MTTTPAMMWPRPTAPGRGGRRCLTSLSPSRARARTCSLATMPQWNRSGPERVWGCRPSQRMLVSRIPAHRHPRPDALRRGNGCPTRCSPCAAPPIGGILSACRHTNGHPAASWLLPIRRWLVELGGARIEPTTLRLGLSQIGGWARQRRGRVRLRLPSSHPSQGWWDLLATRRGRPRISRARIAFWR